MRETVRQAAWAILIGLCAAMLVPACVGVARADAIPVAPEAVALDIGGMSVWAVGLALAVEWVRSLVPGWRRGVRADAKALAAVDHVRALGADPAHVETLRRLAVATGGLSETAKTALRIVPVLLGVIAGVAGWAPAVGDGSQPEIVGGVGAGLVASLFGGQIMSAVRSRLPGAASRRSLAGMTTERMKIARAEDEAAE